MPRRRRFSVLLAATALLLAPAAPAAAGGPPVVFPDPFAFTGPDYENGLVVFVNTSRESFCTPEQVDREQMVVDWLLGGMVDPVRCDVQVAAKYDVVAGVVFLIEKFS
jgi:hypothetical protein